MSSEDLTRFLKALDAVKGDYTCGVCLKLCKKPVTLSKCFHIICAEHFDGLKTCPNCSADLKSSTFFVDERMESCINSTKELDEMFEKFRNNPTISSNKESVKVNTNKSNRERKDDVESEKPKLRRVRADNDEIETIKLSGSIPDLNITEDNGVPKKSHNVTKKIETGNDRGNISFLSNASSKFNKTIEKRNNKGETTLHIACRLGKYEKVVELLKQGANTNTKDNAGWTPLHEVVQNGRLDLVQLLLQYNALINIPGQSNETPLHEAIRYGYDNIVEELVKNGADIHARNCKGETPMDLATDQMKKIIEKTIENAMQTQSVNITHISELHSKLDFEDIRVYSVSQYRTVHNKLKNLMKHHSNLRMEVKFTKNVTHLIVDTEDDGICTSSLDVLQGIVSSIWILSSKWVTKSTDKKLEPFENYEVKGVSTTTNQGPRNSRYNKYKQLPGIFNGCHFYLHNFNSKYKISDSIVLTKSILTKLISDAGGIVLRRAPNPESIPDSEKLVPYHAKRDGKLMNCSHYIIFKDMYEPMYNMQHLKALPIGWLIECIERYELCEPWVGPSQMT